MQSSFRRSFRVEAPVLLWGGALLCLLLVGCRGAVKTEPPIHLNPNMDNQARFDPQEPNDFFEDRRAMRLPVEGTVRANAPQGDKDPCILEFTNEHLCQGKVQGEFSAELPMEISLAFMQRGQERYDIFCQPCHDVAGYGKGPIVERGMLPPPSFHDDRLRKMNVGQLYDIVKNGVRNMPGYAAQIPTEDRWAVAAYVRALQRSQNVSLDDIPAGVAKSEGWK